ncbi:MAG: hypothetical protein A3G09_00290 [Candidatus Moranbacteria bacterium RIFCSPLOWO2_12_FULL_48_12]|nr:MAG: hypothetical protein A3G09_00290 [Candidatus Moranbacteria bacterium RIFCSPLOWO2_12_FULL_48_12]
MKNPARIAFYFFLALASVAVVFVFYSAEFWFQKTYHSARYVVGTVRELTETELVLQRRDGNEQVVLMEKETDIRKGRSAIQDDLHTGDRVLVVGVYDEQNQLQARLIRLLGSGACEAPITSFCFDYERVE